MTPIQWLFLLFMLVEELFPESFPCITNQPTLLPDNVDGAWYTFTQQVASNFIEGVSSVLTAVDISRCPIQSLI
ncbi:hypothetical protein ASF84_22055 [Pseudomonas sp. Leaf127]|uniref:hypothetical protein n=1 Tax=Pseudomonas sp. Leaf127 TaxID=1736267 RepID=UPI000702FE33|nr:hypothetical protein [Pseudomonas sp. Leaf127]KQQ49893.1 hypothetical protein ASF84_22055 [Pseudomonas sp. Leaf127]